MGGEGDRSDAGRRGGPDRRGARRLVSLPVDPGPALPARRAFHELPNVLITPHLSGWTEGMLEARAKLQPLIPRLPFFYGWVIVAVAFLTMGVGVNTRTAFSLLFPPILDEFGWERGVTAGAFSFGFLVTAVLSPSLGRLMDRRGPRVVIALGVGLMAAGLMLATLVRQPWHLYATLGVLVGGGGVCLGYTGQALFLPNWFVRQRGLAMSVVFSGVGVGSIILLPWLQTLIGRAGWRAAIAASSRRLASEVPSCGPRRGLTRRSRVDP